MSSPNHGTAVRVTTRAAVSYPAKTFHPKARYVTHILHKHSAQALITVYNLDCHAFQRGTEA